MRFENRSRVSTYLSNWMPTNYPVHLSVAGYAAGGTDVGGALSGIDKIAFPADTRTTLSATLTSNKDSVTGFANSGVAGYALGGSTNSNGIDKIAFPSDTKSTLSATLTNSSTMAGAFANSNVAGYYAGGYNAGLNTNYSTIDKITFPADSKSTLVATLTAAQRGVVGFSNSGTAGYAAGGDGPNTNRIDKITFSNDSKSTLVATLTDPQRAGSGFADKGVAGYYCGGRNNGDTFLDRIDKITFSSDTKSTLGAVLSRAKQNAGSGGFADKTVAGYMCGGNGGATNEIDKIAFPGDTKSTLSATLTTARWNLAGFADEGIF